MNVLDSNRTIGFKKADMYNIPVNYVHVTGSGNTTNLIKYMRKIEENTDSVKVVVEKVIEDGKFKVSPEHIIYIYYQLTRTIVIDEADIVMLRHGLNPFGSRDDFIERYARWSNVFNTLKLNTIMTASKIRNIQSKLLSYNTDSHPYTIKQSRSTIMYKTLPQTNMSIDWDITSIYDIMDNITMSQQIPFVQSPNNSRGSIYKLYFSDDSVNMYNHNNFLFFSQEASTILLMHQF